MGKRLGYDSHFGGLVQGRPTQHPPGSSAKVALLEARRAAGIALWNKDDAPLNPELLAGGVYNGVSTGWAWENDEEEAERPTIAMPAGWRGHRSAFGLREGHGSPTVEIVRQTRNGAVPETQSPRPGDDQGLTGVEDVLPTVDQLGQGDQALSYIARVAQVVIIPVAGALMLGEEVCGGPPDDPECIPGSQPGRREAAESFIVDREERRFNRPDGHLQDPPQLGGGDLVSRVQDGNQTADGGVPVEGEELSRARLDELLWFMANHDEWGRCPPCPESGGADGDRGQGGQVREEFSAVEHDDSLQDGAMLW